MPIKNILLATLFVATSQVFCADEQTDIKAKLRAELEAEINAKYEALSNLSKKITEQEIVVQELTNKVHESIIKYAKWQDKKDATNNLAEKNADETTEYFTKQLNTFQNTLCNLTKNGTQMQTISFDEEYKNDNKLDHELFIYHILMAEFDAQELNALITEWKICLNQIMNLEEQLAIT